jgi:cyanamide hydratase
MTHYSGISQDKLEEYGWNSVPRSQSAVLKTRQSGASASISDVEKLPLPDTTLAQSILEYARQELPGETFHHSMRVYHYGESAGNVI